MNKKKLTALSAVLLLAVNTSLTACSKTGAPAAIDQTIVVSTTTAQSGAMERMGNYVGTVADTEAVYVVPLVSAKVTALPVHVGDKVEAGQLLCSLDDTVAQFKLSAAKADYNMAKNGMNTAKAGYETAVASYENAVISADSQLGGSKTLTDYQTQMSIQSLEDQLENLQNTINGYTALVDNANKAESAAKAELEAAQAAYQTAQAVYEQALLSGGGVATSGNAQVSRLSEAKAAMESAAARLSNARDSYTKAATQVTTVNDGALTLLQNKDTLEKSIEQAKQQKEIADKDIYNDTLDIIDSTKRVAQSGIDSAQAGLEAAQIGLDAAQIGLDSAEYELSLYTMTAPIDGIIEQVNLSENNMAGAGNIGFVISNPNTRSVIFFVSEDVRNVLQNGQEVTASCAGAKYQGIITEIGISVDSTTGLFRIKAALKDAVNVANGTKVEIVTKSHEAKHTILVPWESVYFENGTTYLYVMKDGRAVKTIVEIALYDTETLALSSGVMDGDEIITSWSSALKDGAEVRKSTQED